MCVPQYAIFYFSPLTFSYAFILWNLVMFNKLIVFSSTKYISSFALFHSISRYTITMLVNDSIHLI